MLKDTAEMLPSAEDIIRALGLERRGSGDLMPSLALFGAGILVGAGLALLFAPTSGQELREDIGHRVDELRNRVSSEAEHGDGSETRSSM